MDLRKRLERLDQLSRRPHSPLPEPVRTPTSVPWDELGLQPPVPGARIGVRRMRYPWPSPGLSTSDLAGFFPSLPDDPLAAGDLLFLDTETTGLAGGTGTLAFLVGLAWWEGGEFVVEQIMMTGPEGECSLLERVGDATRGRRAVVTFNGAAFDLPLLRTRGILNRLRDLLTPLFGLDLVVPARRLWGRVLPDCRQQTLENRICGLKRGPGDIDGRDIPAAWFAFLHGEDVGGMVAILEHNRRDMCGMGRLWEQLGSWAAHVDGTAALEPAPPGEPWAVAWSLARVALLRGRGDRIGPWLTTALDALPAGIGPSEPRLERFLRDGIRLAKRRRDWPLLQRFVEDGLAVLPGTPWLHREAAILHEHRLRDLDTALHHALQCAEPGRIARLERRIERRGPQPRTGGGS